MDLSFSEQINVLNKKLDAYKQQEIKDKKKRLEKKRLKLEKTRVSSSSSTVKTVPKKSSKSVPKKSSSKGSSISSKSSLISSKGSFYESPDSYKSSSLYGDYDKLSSVKKTLIIFLSSLAIIGAGSALYKIADHTGLIKKVKNILGKDADITARPADLALVRFQEKQKSSSPNKKQHVFIPDLTLKKENVGDRIDIGMASIKELLEDNTVPASRLKSPDRSLINELPLKNKSPEKILIEELPEEKKIEYKLSSSEKKSLSAMNRRSSGSSSEGSASSPEFKFPEYNMDSGKNNTTKDLSPNSELLEDFLKKSSVSSETPKKQIFRSRPSFKK